MGYLKKKLKEIKTSLTDVYHISADQLDLFNLKIKHIGSKYHVCYSKGWERISVLTVLIADNNDCIYFKGVGDWEGYTFELRDLRKEIIGKSEADFRVYRYNER